MMIRKKNRMNQCDWRTYQQQLNSNASRRRRREALLKYSIPVLVVAVIFFCAYYLSVYEHPSGRPPMPSPSPKPGTTGKAAVMDKLGARRFLEGVSLENLQEKQFPVVIKNRRFVIGASVDTELQKFLLNRLDTKNARYIGIVVLEPTSGSVMAMIGYNRSGDRSNPCTDVLYPAASIFKIVTAAAALEKTGLTPDKLLNFNGSKHTLYKSQLRETANRYTTRISFKDAFAQSVNPVFGKIGAQRLGKTALEEYAYAFGFNSEIPFEMKNSAGTLQVAEDPYNWAEIACGFNKKTKISVLHGALIAAAMINGGKFIEPTIIKSIHSEADGMSIYRGTAVSYGQAISAETSRKMETMMQRTVTAGTFKKAFRGMQKDPVLSKLRIGAKSGSMGSNPRHDWFVGFAATTGRQPVKMALSVIVVHEDYIGKKAGKYARDTINHYFGRILPGQQKQVRHNPMERAAPTG